MEPATGAAWINLLAVIDTGHVKSTCPDPSQDAKHPTEIGPGGVFMICPGWRDDDPEQETDEPCVTIGHGSRVALRGVSISNNSDDAVIVYAVDTRNGEENRVSKSFKPVVVTREEAVQPDPDSSNGGIPPLHVETNFSSLNARFIALKSRVLNADFALYTLAEDGQSQQLLGYYFWKFRVRCEQP
ncbi:MAG: hypothetical protein A2W72_15295 [Burkholderiales bacterium RIFCSPLOWO2_12_67_14]|nr:MAG: hypothetical protein A3I64_23265 [Burkholderiales bacterium RIFCSPLOWO2_02_FULL_67_64]OGB39463.1 MAG: hypothetical protein A2W72_15295 [Burkholderiales bacterium RIFCSPLOWO2_12_67_14]OGB45011.1 MAG: hypothetical protein A3E51_11295 [Burkholderiales bacterium RIFCSPHIGHO2_12_FULL_67_38]OGC01036.1 MAG: hypothetical protein A3G82_19825 [Burkholderiales bacterium RIFCSPLOWO2_12_FULL_67_210]